MKETIEDLKTRRSIRKFKDEQISDEDLKKAMDIFEEAVIAVNKKYGK